MVGIETTGGSNGEKNGLWFVTIHGVDNGGIQNPWSVPIIEALRQRDFIATVNDSLHTGELEAVENMVVVPIFDRERGVKRFSPCLCTASGIPDWVRKISTGPCIAVGEKCVSFSHVIEATARQIVHLFLPRRKHDDESFWWTEPSMFSRASGRWRLSEN